MCQKAQTLTYRQTERLYGIDLLRIISMLMIVVCHICGNGGVINAVSDNVWKYISAEFWCIATTACINIYAIISGFVGLNGGTGKRLNRFFKLWVEVVFWCLLFAVIGYFGGFEGYGITSFGKAVLPVAANQYWYFTAYFGVVLVAPVINKAIQNMNGRETAIINIILFAFFSIYSNSLAFLQGDPFSFKSGYSFAWLSYMYFIGGSIKKYYYILKCKKKLLFAVTGICFLLSLIWTVSSVLWFQLGEYLFSVYTSPTILLISVGFLMIFADMQFNKAVTRIIKFLSPACFGVYLIHVNGFIWDNFWYGGFAWIANYNAALIFLLIPLCAVAVYIACTLLEKLRILLFELLRIDKLCDIIYNAIYKIAIKYYNKLQRKFLNNRRA